MSTSAYVLDVNTETNVVRAVYVHWDGGDLLAKMLKDNYIGNESRMNDLFSFGYASDVSETNIVRNNKQEKIVLSNEIEIDNFIETYYIVEYFHIIKNGELVTMNVDEYTELGVNMILKDHIMYR